MLTYCHPNRGLARVLLLLGVLVLGHLIPATAVAQERRYLFELGAAGTYQSFGDTTKLGSAGGGLARLGLWLPLNFSLEAEGSVASADGISVKTAFGSVLYNLLLGSSTWGYLKAGIGGTRYGGSGDACLTDPKFFGKICGTTTAFVT